ncbi:MAG: hypothetical protein L0229_14110 [Blastocatellia bacterium]|nr:hypothetical protein [Blastocatellia bacterium]
MSKLLKNSDSTLRDELIEQGQRIYDAQLRERLERENKGRFVAIEPATGRYFLGDTGTEALIAARAAMPDSLFYLARIGQKAAHTIGGHALRIR